MAKGNEIIVSTEPKGRFEGCIIDGTPKPGTCMQMKVATEPVQGQYTFEVYNLAADGDPAAVVVLREDNMQGKTATQAYADNDQGFLYWPQVGECLNMLVDASLGAIAIGDKFSIDDGTGKLIAGGAAALTFQSMETVANPAVDTLVCCRCIRNC